MVELAGATLVPGTIDIHGELPSRRCCRCGPSGWSR